MKYRNLFYLLPIAALGLTLTSCEPDEPTPAPEPSPSNVVKSTTIGYDETGKPSDTTVSINIFDSQNRIVKQSTDDGSVVDYTYSASNITIKSANPNDPTENITLVYSLDAQGRMSYAPLELFGFKIGSIHHDYYPNDKLKSIGFFSIQSGDTSKTNYTWTGDNNTLQSEAMSTTTFDFDLTKRDLRNFGSEDLQRSRNKNILTKETVNTTGEPAVINTYEYEYDATGRPVKEIIKQGGIKVSETTYEY